MQAIRTFLHRHRQLALALVALALVMKALVPVGFMPAAGGKVLSVMVCDGTGMVQAAKIAVPGDGPAGQADAAKADGTCPYAGLSFGMVSGTDALLAAALIVFILTLGFAPATVTPRRRAHHVQPPQCGPPALA